MALRPRAPVSLPPHLQGHRRPGRETYERLDEIELDGPQRVAGRAVRIQLGHVIRARVLPLQRQLDGAFLHAEERLDAVPAEVGAVVLRAVEVEVVGAAGPDPVLDGVLERISAGGSGRRRNGRRLSQGGAHTQQTRGEHEKDRGRAARQKTVHYGKATGTRPSRYPCLDQGVKAGATPAPQVATRPALGRSAVRPDAWIAAGVGAVAARWWPSTWTPSCRARYRATRPCRPSARPVPRRDRPGLSQPRRSPR